MDGKEKERRINNIRLRAVVLKGLVIDLKKTGGIDMRKEIINFFEEEEEENGRKEAKREI